MSLYFVASETRDGDMQVWGNLSAESRDHRRSVMLNEKMTLAVTAGPMSRLKEVIENHDKRYPEKAYQP